VAPAELLACVEHRLRGLDSWVVDGNYFEEVGAPVVWPAADALVWLDLPRSTAYRRTVIRTARRALTRRPLWHGNRETIANLGPRSLLRLWTLWPRYGEQIAALLATPAFDALRVVRLRSPADVTSWLDEVA
jgi:hypothetical protein